MWLRELLRSGFLRHSGGEGSIQDDMMSSRGVSAPALWDLNEIESAYEIVGHVTCL